MGIWSNLTVPSMFFRVVSDARPEVGDILRDAMEQVNQDANAGKARMIPLTIQCGWRWDEISRIR